MMNKNAMINEIVKREALLGIPQSTIELWKVSQVPIKVCVDHENKRVCSEELTEDEAVLIQDYEKSTGYIVYYVMKDKGLWPDGSEFPRYTFLYVDDEEEEWEMIDEECIQDCGTIPAYIINMDDMECSEYAEISFRNINGLIINAS